MHLLPELASHHAASIPELLVSRDERQARQHVQLKRHPVPLVSFTVVVPRPIKGSKVTRRILNHGVTTLRTLAAEQGWQIQGQVALVSAGGLEGMLSITAPACDFKLATVKSEYSHPSGRLWDIDVLTPEDKVLSRHDYSLPPRRCLLCERSAAVHTRGKTHQLTDLLSRTEAPLNDVDAYNINQNHRACGVINRRMRPAGLARHAD